MGAYDEIYCKLAARLDDLRRRTKRINLANGGLRFLAVSLLSFLIVAAIESAHPSNGGVLQFQHKYFRWMGRSECPPRPS